MKPSILFCFYLLLFTKVIYSHPISEVDTLKYYPQNEVEKRNSSTEVSGFAHFDNHLYIASDGAGIFKMQDSGSSFSVHNEGLEKLNVTAVETHKNRLFCATKFNGLYIYKKATDRWYRLKKGLSDSIFWSLKSNGNYLFATSESNGVFRSQDGLKWEKLKFQVDNRLNNFALEAITGKTVLHTKGKVVFLLMPKRLMVSTNNGKSWRHLKTPVRGDYYLMQHLHGSGDTLVLSFRFGGIYVSYNGGLKWQIIESKPRSSWSSYVLNGKIWMCNPFHSRDDNYGVFLLNNDSLENIVHIPSIGHITYHKGYYFAGASKYKLYRFKYP